MRVDYMSSVFDIDDAQNETSVKDQLIKQFGEWWGDEEIRTIIIPKIVGKKIRSSVEGALKNYTEKNQNVKKFAEILYDLVGQNFLVNKDKSIRFNFLRMLLEKRYETDPTFQDRFFQMLEIRLNASKPETCVKCDSEWNKEDKIYRQVLGTKPIQCIDRQCFKRQQQKKIPKINESEFACFVDKLDKGGYKKFCKKMLDEFDFPREVITQPAREIKLLPETIRPMGEFLHLYDYQASIGLKIRNMLEAYDSGTSRAMVVLPTGAGKTRLVVETLIEWLNNGKRGKEDSRFIVWIVDKTELCQQAFDTFADVFRHRGRMDSSLKLYPVYGNNAKNIRNILYQHSPDADSGGEIFEENGVVIGTIQSLYSMSKNDDRGSLPQLGEYTSLVVIDEAHHASSSNKSYNAVLRELGFNFSRAAKGGNASKNKTCLIGLTATPFRGGTDSKGTEELLRRFGGRKRIIWPSFSDTVKKETNLRPYAHVHAQKIAYVGEIIRLYGEDSYDRDGRIVEYRFIIEKIKESSETVILYDKWHSEKNIDYTFDDPGEYKIRLIVKDDDDACSNNPSSRTIDVLATATHNDMSNVAAMERLYKHLIKREILSKPHHYIIDSKTDLQLDVNDEEHFKQYHDISNQKVKKIGYDSHRNRLIVEKIESLIRKEGRSSVLFFACSVEHSKLISFILDAIYGIASASIDHETSPEERDGIIHDFRTRKISVLCNYGILSTGFDSPKVDCVFVSRPTFSHLLYNQMTGRGLRGPKSQGTSNCVIVDISDNIQLISDKEAVKQPWMLFDYIYESVYDERNKEPQKCFGCFGKCIKYVAHKKTKCQICGGRGHLRRGR